MLRLLLCFVLAYGGYVAAEDSAGVIWLGAGKAKCGGILIEPDVVLSTKSCIKSSYEVLWPFKSGFSLPLYEHNSADLIVIFLERAWSETVRLIHTSELSNLTKGLPVHFSNKHYSTRNWIDDLGQSTITAFYGLERPLIGSPMWSDFGIVGMMIGDKTALRLDPYFGFITATIRTGRGKRPKRPTPISVPETPNMIVIEAQHVQAAQPTPAAQPEQVIQPAAKPVLSVEPVPVVPSVEIKPPESLGCACSQARRRRSTFWSARFFGRFFR
jgi:hypothetical protein